MIIILFGWDLALFQICMDTSTCIALARVTKYAINATFYTCNFWLIPSTKLYPFLKIPTFSTKWNLLRAQRSSFERILELAPGLKWGLSCSELQDVDPLHHFQPMKSVSEVNQVLPTLRRALTRSLRVFLKKHTYYYSKALVFKLDFRSQTLNFLKSLKKTFSREELERRLKHESARAPIWDFRLRIVYPKAFRTPCAKGGGRGPTP